MSFTWEKYYNFRDTSKTKVESSLLSGSFLSPRRNLVQVDVVVIQPRSKTRHFRIVLAMDFRWNHHIKHLLSVLLALSTSDLASKNRLPSLAFLVFMPLSFLRGWNIVALLGAVRPVPGLFTLRKSKQGSPWLSFVVRKAVDRGFCKKLAYPHCPGVTGSTVLLLFGSWWMELVHSALECSIPAVEETRSSSVLSSSHSLLFVFSRCFSSS